MIRGRTSLIFDGANDRLFLRKKMHKNQYYAFHLIFAWNAWKLAPLFWRKMGVRKNLLPDDEIIVFLSTSSRPTGLE